jgi:hypothetical protein
MPSPVLLASKSTLSGSTTPPRLSFSVMVTFAPASPSCSSPNSTVRCTPAPESPLRAPAARNQKPGLAGPHANAASSSPRSLCPNSRPKFGSETFPPPISAVPRSLAPAETFTLYRDTRALGQTETGLMCHGRSSLRNSLSNKRGPPFLGVADQEAAGGVGSCHPPDW